MSILEHFFLVYEEFYIVEEQTDKLVYTKIFEFILFYIFIVSAAYSAGPTILKAVLIRIFAFVLLALHAFSRWKILPSFRANPRVITLAVLIASAFYLVITK